MMRYTTAFLLLLSIGFWGCDHTQSPIEPVGKGATTTQAQPLGRLFIPDGATLVSATLEVYVTAVWEPGIVEVHRVTAPWDECTPTWSTFNDKFEPAVVASITPATTGWVSFNITSLATSWIANPAQNYGLVLKQSTGATLYHSSEVAGDAVGLRPRLVLVFNGPQGLRTTVIVRGGLGEVFDTYIWQPSPDYTGCSQVTLYSGWVYGGMKYAFLRFVYDSPGTGCTRTPGYWQTHSKYGPAPYNSTWALITPNGEDTPFFLSGQSYFQVLKANSSGGAYYVLAQAYIAAKLNFLAGVSKPSPVQIAFDQATTLFQTYTPLQIKNMQGNNPVRAAFIALAGILDNYNNGLSGPGHCE